MAKISELPVASALTGTELLEAVQGGKNVKITVDALKGREGLSAYELAVSHGFDGTLTEWLDSIRGIDGTRWYVTDGAPSISLGVAGDFAIDRTTTRYYLKHSVGVWIDQGLLIGQSVLDAPIDGRPYLRKDGNWTAFDRLAVMGAIGASKDPKTGDWLIDSGQLS